MPLSHIRRFLQLPKLLSFHTHCAVGDLHANIDVRWLCVSSSLNILKIFRNWWNEDSPVSLSRLLRPQNILYFLQKIKVNFTSTYVFAFHVYLVICNLINISPKHATVHVYSNQVRIWLNYMLSRCRTDTRSFHYRHTAREIQPCTCAFAVFNWSVQEITRSLYPSL